MQFDKDLNSKHAKLFLDIRELVCNEIGEGFIEKYSDNITTYKSEEGGICYLKTYETYVHIGWFRGLHIDDKYDFLFGTGKSIRGQKITTLSKEIKQSIKYYIHETTMFLIEHNELQKMRRK